MKIRRKFNTLTFNEYIFYLDRHKDFSDFNVLCIFRSIIENDNLSVDEKIFIRDYANRTFGKTFNFLQLKDPDTYFKLSTIGVELTTGDRERLWETTIKNQQKSFLKKR